MDASISSLNTTLPLSALTPKSTKRQFSSYSYRSRQSINNSTIIKRKQNSSLSRFEDQSDRSDSKYSHESMVSVVRNYLLPMFQSNQTPKARLNQTQGGFRQLEAINGTVFGELKRTDNLMGQYESLSYETAILEQQLADAKQVRQSALFELSNIKKQRSVIQDKLKYVRDAHFNTKAQTQQQQHKIVQTEQHLGIYKKLAQLTHNSVKLYRAQLHDEKALNDKRKNVTIELEQNNTLLRLENDIIDEKMETLYERFQHLKQMNIFDRKLENETSLAADSFELLGIFYEEFHEDISYLSNHYLNIQQDSSEMHDLLSISTILRDKLANQSKETVQNLQKDLSTIQERNDTFKEKNAALDKVYRETTEELNKLRKKLKILQQVRGDSEEKVCKRCSRVYYEHENFNWSCRVHLSEFSGNQYWCCGKNTKESIGCNVSCHEPKEEEEELVDSRDRLSRANHICSSCKTVGHKPHECPKDPNVRSIDEIEEEVDRINNISNKRRQNSDTAVNQKTMSILKVRFGNFAFGDDAVSSINSEESNIELNDRQRKKNPFNDISEVLKEVSDDEDDTKFKIIVDKGLSEIGPGLLKSRRSSLLK